jgi:pimeloyl-ACP methyl ester carboxylesterase
MPVRVLWGADDAWVPTSTAERLRGLIPRADLSLIDGAGHLVQYDAPVALMDRIRTWLAEN